MHVSPCTIFSQVLLFGGGTRIPRVRDLVLTAAKGHQQLGMSLNTDESAALGAVYQAAHLSKGFRVKKFLVKDANVFPIEVRWITALCIGSLWIFQLGDNNDHGLIFFRSRLSSSEQSPRKTPERRQPRPRAKLSRVFFSRVTTPIHKRKCSRSQNIGKILKYASIMETSPS